MIVTIGSTRGGVGATSWSLLLASAWPTAMPGDRIVIEADPSGGVLGTRFGWGVDPGVVSLVAALGHRVGPQVPVDEHGRHVSPRMWVVPGPETAEQSTALWTTGAPRVARWLADDDRLWLVDAGRLDGESPLLPLIGASSLVVLVCRGLAEELLAVPSRMAALRAGGAGEIAVLVVGSCPYRLDELVEWFATSSVWLVAGEDELVKVTRAVLGRGRARFGWLWREASEVAARAAHLATAAATATAPAPSNYATQATPPQPPQPPPQPPRTTPAHAAPTPTIGVAPVAHADGIAGSGR